MKKQWDAYNTGEPFTYNFMDDLFNKTYAAEQKTGTVLKHLFAAYHFRCMPWFIWVGDLHSGTTYKRNRDKKSIRRKCYAGNANAF